MRLLLIPAVVILMLGPLAAHAADLGGVWEGRAGITRIRFTPCEQGLCGRIVWIRPGARSKARLNEPVFTHLIHSGDSTWTGEASNPEDGRTYQTTVTVEGRHLLVRGCVLGGMICKSEIWTKVG